MLRVPDLEISLSQQCYRRLGNSEARCAESCIANENDN